MNLYFLDKDDKQHLVKKNVIEPGGLVGCVVDYVLEDLKTRKPGYFSGYQRTWWDNFGRLWIDFGSHTEFYICQEEKYALNIADAEKAENSCNEDYCEI